MISDHVTLKTGVMMLKTILNCNNISEYLSFCCIFDQIYGINKYEQQCI